MTYERDPVIASLASRARDQVRCGTHELHAGNPLAAEVFFRAAVATLESLNALLDEPPAKPLRKLAIVGTAAAPHDETMPEWFLTKHGDDPDGAA